VGSTDLIIPLLILFILDGDLIWFVRTHNLNFSKRPNAFRQAALDNRRTLRMSDELFKGFTEGTFVPVYPEERAGCGVDLTDPSALRDVKHSGRQQLKKCPLRDLRHARIGHSCSTRCALDSKRWLPAFRTVEPALDNL
jgi:hypothetical protein